MPKSIKKVEIFAIGKWNGKTFSLDDLEDMVHSFNELRSVLQVPLKLGHNDAQSLKDGELALGWVDKIYIVDGKLVADFVNVPEIVFNAIQQKLYRKVSVELYFDVSYKNQHFKHILTAVALLGAELPAVNTLADIGQFLDNAANSDFSFSTKKVAFSAISIKSYRGNLSMTEEEIKALKAQLAAAEAEKAAFKVQLETAKAVADAAEKKRLEDEKKARVDMKRKAVTEMLEKAVTDKRILPAARESFSAILKINTDAVESVSVEDVEKLIKSVEVKSMGDFSNQQGNQNGNGAEEGMTADAIIAKRANEHVAKFNVSFKDACKSVMAADPELSRKWVEMNSPRTA